MAQLDFDATGIDPNKKFDPLPEGIYTVVLDQSQWKDTKKRDARYLHLTFKVIKGEYKGRHLFDRLLLKHPNSQTVEYARRDLSALCHATGKLKVADSTELHDLPVNVKVKCENTGDGVDNVIAKYESPSAQSPPAEQKTSNDRPW